MNGLKHATVLVAGLWLLRAFVEADPKTLARGVRWLAWVVGATALLVLLVVLLASDRLAPAVINLGVLVPVVMRLRSLWRRQRATSAPPPGRSSEVETSYIRMRLDHDSNTMSGTVRRGAFQGRRLDELSPDEVIALWRECRAEDEQGASLIEAYLDRLMPEWREAAARSAGTGSAPPGAMTREEAYAILGLAPGASAAEVREAHRRLMMKNHPDQGGSTYLAAKINRAREILLDD